MKEEIIERLNKYLNDEFSIRYLCFLANNDKNTFYKMLSRIINYAFIQSSEFLNNTYNLVNSYYLVTSFSLHKRAPITNSDLDKINIPSPEMINYICENNKKEFSNIDNMKGFISSSYDVLSGFDEVGLSYTRPELVRLDSTFRYRYADSTGIVSEDYNMLCRDERYSSNADSPYKRSFSENLNSIVENNDIRITKNGGLYEIYNGRHRLLYLLNNGSSLDIPCLVTKRFEDREVNLLLLELKNKYHASFHKNSIFNDDIDVLIIIEDRMYNIKNKDELFDFENNKEKYYVGEYKNYGLSSKLSMAYEKRLIELAFEEGLSILEGNYTDILKYFPNLNTNLLFNMFSGLQEICAKNMVYKDSRNINNILLDEYYKVVEKIKHILEKEEAKKR